MKAIQIEEFGGPEQMKVAELADPEPADGMVVVDVARSGVNFADTHAIRNDYLAEQALPLVPGGEISGTTSDGRRVAAMLGGGGYAQKVAVPEAFLVPVPDEVNDDEAAGLLLQGVTAHCLLHHCAHVREGESVVIEAAAGGTGSLAVQLAKRAGAKVIALASSDEKRKLAERLGADATADSRAEDLTAEIIEANGGDKTDVVLQMSGTGFEAELKALDTLGRIVVFGNAARHPNQVETNYLLQTSKSVIGFWLVPMIVKRRDLVTAAIGELLGAVASGELEVVIGGVYPLSEAARAHQDLAARRSTGKLLLDPSK
ncbi:MAG: Alcohol dehydrogenase zinc-binding domain protein [Solirubrobacterales bacterium]|nr:Alcohol dehydrogenase zinc-binding domain protein [Solirubrobacterales bacterium]